jgi:membrane associated rhomboid family serine protease
VQDGPLQLFVWLLALVTLSAEMEALLGHSAFAMVFFSSLMTASFADALLGALPVTQGGYPALAGMLGALLAHQVGWQLHGSCMAAAW